MKNNLFPSLLLLMGFLTLCTSNAQDLKSSSSTHTRQIIDATAYQGKAFKLSAAIRKVPTNGNEKAGIFIGAWKADNSLAFFSRDIGDRPVDTQWHVYAIEGTMDKETKRLFFGASSEYNGTFYFDDFKLQVETKKGHWETIPIKNPDFEETPKSKDIWDSKNTNRVKQFTNAITDQNPFSGNHCLVVEGKGVYGQQDEYGGFVEANGLEFYYETHGEGEPLLLLHGAGQSISAFMEQIDFFSQHYKVIAVDSRGRGRSQDKKEEDFTYVEQAKDMKLFLEALKIEKVDIVGWSDGGIIGLIMAMYHPEKVNKLVAMGANINPDGLFPDRIAQHKEYLKELEAENDEKNAITIKIYEALVNRPNLTFEELKVIAAPTLIMAGDHDLIQDMHTVKMYQAIPNANLAILPGETHWLPSANPKLFNDTVWRFLSKEFKEPRRF